MRILVTGRRGQLARSLAERASLHPGLELVAVGRPKLEMAEPGSAERMIGKARPGLVINTAAYTAVDQAEDEPDLAHRINTEAAGEIARAARQVGAPIIQLSTDYVFDGSASKPYREDAATNPANTYGLSKLAGEEAVRAASPDHMIVRTAWLYSPFGRNFVRTMVEAAKSRPQLSVVADQHGSPTSALDLAGALLAVAGRWANGDRVGLGETYHLAAPGEASWFDLAGQVMVDCAALGLPHVPVKPIATADWPTPARRPAYSALDSGKFARDFGIILPDWRLSVGEVVARVAALNRCDGGG